MSTDSIGATPPVSAHDWFLPRLEALLRDAAAAGIARDVAEAVISDLVNGALAAPVAAEDENWARDFGEPAGAASEMPPHGDGLPPEGDVKPDVWQGRGMHLRGMGTRR